MDAGVRMSSRRMDAVCAAAGRMIAGVISWRPATGRPATGRPAAGRAAAACARSAGARVHTMGNAAILASMLAGIAPAPVHAAPEEHVVVIENMRFAPEQLTVQAGDRITWVNKDLVPHTASATQGGFDSQNIAPGASWTYTAGAAGSYTYACRYHPGMTATLVIR